MNFLETKRLVRKIVELIGGGGDPTLAPKFAEDFSVACRAVTLRLHQCEAMIASGDSAQALQLAETPPLLLDLITALEFRQASEWRAYCREHTLTVAETLDERAVQALNECYARGINTDHPLYRDYRRAMVLNDDAGALRVLQAIARLNPSDDNAQKELTRLGAKVLKAKFGKLEKLLASGDVAAVSQAVVEIESAGFQGSPAGEVWKQAQALRCSVLLDYATEDRTRGNWRGTLDLLDVIAGLERDWSFTVRNEDITRLKELRRWAEAERHEFEQQREFAGLLSQLRQLIGASEEKEVLAREVALSELKLDLETLQKTWRAIEQFARPVPDPLPARYRKRVTLLQAEVSRRMRTRVALIGACSLAGLLIIGAASWWFLLHLRQGEFATQLDQSVTNRLVRTASKLIAQCREKDAAVFNSAAARPTVGRAESFIAAEVAKLESFDKVFRQLPETVTTLTNAAQITSVQQQLTGVTNRMAQLAPDLRTEKEPAVRAFETIWQRHLMDRSAELNRGFAGEVRGGEELAERMNFGLPITDARGASVALTRNVEQLGQEKAMFDGIVEWRRETLQRLQELRNKSELFAEELRKFDNAFDALSRAKNLAEHDGAIAALAASQFSTAPEIRAAAAVRDLGLTDAALLRSLVCGNDENLWNYFSMHPGSEFVPKIAMKTEKERFLALRDDPAISTNLFRYALSPITNEMAIMQWITVGPLAAGDQWTTASVFALNAEATMCDFRSTRYGLFGGRLMGGPNNELKVHSTDICREAAPFFSLNLPRLIALHNDTFPLPLLKTLSELRQNQEGSSVFRGYLFLRLCEFMDYQAKEWGMPFTPALALDRQRLLDAGAAQIRSGDWLVPSRLARFTDPMNAFFRSKPSVSYWDQAQAVAGVYRSLLSTGLHYAGYADSEGKPILIDNGAREIWGWTTGERTPAVLSEKNGNGWKTIAAPLPCSPLFGFSGDRAALLASDELRRGGPEINAVLPRVFRGAGGGK